MPWFAVVLPYRRLDPADPPYWSLRELAGTSWSSRPWPVARCRAGPGSDGFLIGSALSGLGLGLCLANDLALVTELLYAVAGGCCDQRNRHMPRAHSEVNRAQLSVMQPHQARGAERVETACSPAKTRRC
jgi:hypothetical protein